MHCHISRLTSRFESRLFRAKVHLLVAHIVWPCEKRVKPLREICPNEPRLAPERSKNVPFFSCHSRCRRRSAWNLESDQRGTRGSRSGDTLQNFADTWGRCGIPT